MGFAGVSAPSLLARIRRAQQTDEKTTMLSIFIGLGISTKDHSPQVGSWSPIFSRHLSVKRNTL